jgi:hypothetical protein
MVKGIKPKFSSPKSGDVETSRETPVSWIDDNGNTAYIFYITVSALLGKILLSDHSTANKQANKIIAIPGSRAGLVRYKIQQDRRLNHWIIENGWEFVKFRHLRRLSSVGGLNRNNIKEQFSLDPLENTDPQLALF